MPTIASIPKMQPWKAYAFFILKAAISVALIVAVLRQVEFSKVVTSFSSVDSRYVIACVLTAIPINVISAWRWTTLAQEQISFSVALKYTLIGNFYSAFLPGAISGDIARGAALAAKDKSLRTVLLPVSILVDRLIGLAALGVIATVSFALIYITPPAGLVEFRPALMAGTIFSAALAALTLFPFSSWFCHAVRWAKKLLVFDRLRHGVERILDAHSVYTQPGSPLILAFFLSALVHFFTVLGYALALQAIGIDLSLISITIFFSCLSMVLLLPISISGIGVREIVALLFFEVLGAGPEKAIALSWLLLAVSVFMALIGGAVQALELAHRKPPEKMR